MVWIGLVVFVLVWFIVCFELFVCLWFDCWACCVGGLYGLDIGCYLRYCICFVCFTWLWLLVRLVEVRWFCFDVLLFVSVFILFVILDISLVGCLFGCCCLGVY